MNPRLEIYESGLKRPGSLSISDQRQMRLSDRRGLE